MARLVLHVGGHKTATSFVQSTFFGNRALLARHGVFYPAIGPNDAHHALAAPWLRMNDLPEGFFGPGGPDGLWDRIVREHADREGVLFLSAENFSRARPYSVDMADLARRVAPFEQVTVVYAVRHQAELVQSVWTQVAKNRNPPALRAYVQRVLTEHMAGGLWADHNRVLDHILTGFAPEQVRLLDYASFRSAPGGVIGVFLRLLGSDLDPARLPPAPADRANVSPDPLSTWVASRVAGNRTPPPALLAAVEQALRPDGRGPTALLTRDELDRLRRVFAPLNARLEARVRAVQPDFALTEPATAPGTLFRDDLAPDLWERVAAAAWEAGRAGAAATGPATPAERLRGTLRRLRRGIPVWRAGRL